MKIARGIQEIEAPGGALPRPVITIGNFDGVHLGHQKIIRLAVEKARARQGTAVAYTFRPHPRIALRPEQAVDLLSTYDERLEALSSLGVDLAIEEPFIREFSTIPASVFFTDVLLRRLNAEAIVVGYDFAFGKERQGHLDTLSELCKKAGIELTIVDPLRAGGEVVSSSRIREHLKSGRIEKANALLGREFFYRGIVMKGEGRGRKIGFPTANLRPEGKLVLPYGVYATRTAIDGAVHPSVTNLGVRPTFESKEPGPLVETFLLDESRDLYGSLLEVRFVKKLRDERRFSGVEELVRQISVDVKDARKALS